MDEIRNIMIFVYNPVLTKLEIKMLYFSGVIGIAQLCNKAGAKYFTRHDEEAALSFRLQIKLVLAYNYQGV